jgi:hypothetical protein
MKRIIVGLALLITYSCSKTESAPSITPPVAIEEEALKFSIMSDNSSGSIVTSNDTLGIWITVSSKLPTNGVSLSLEIKNTDNNVSVFKIDSSLTTSSFRLKLYNIYVKGNYSVDLNMTSKSKASNSSAQTVRIVKTLKSSYEILTTSQWLSMPNGFASFAQFDYNRDGLSDLIEFQGYDLKVPYTWPGPNFYKNNGTALVLDNAITINNKHIFAEEVINGDFDNDGYIDAFLFTGMDGAGCGNCFEELIPMYILKNNKGNGFLVDSLNFKGVWEAGSSADIDGDGDLDIMAFSLHHEFADGLINRTFINDGKGNFSYKANDIDTLGWVDHAQLIDMNKDSYPDLVINNVPSRNFYSNRLSILWNNKAGGFSYANSIDINVPNDLYFIQLLAHDLDGDGYKELVLPMIDFTGKSQVLIYRTTDNKSFTNTTSTLIPSNSISLPPQVLGTFSISDIDGNGFVDLFVIDKNKNQRWEWNGTSFTKK